VPQFSSLSCFGQGFPNLTNSGYNLWLPQVCTGLFITHFTKSVHLNDGKDFNMRTTHRKKNICKYICACRGLLVLLVATATSTSIAPALERTHKRGRPGAASLATKISWSNAMRFFYYRNVLRILSIYSLYTGSAWDGKMNRRRHLGNRS